MYAFWRNSEIALIPPPRLTFLEQTVRELVGGPNEPLRQGCGEHPPHKITSIVISTLHGARHPVVQTWSVTIPSNLQLLKGWIIVFFTDSFPHSFLVAALHLQKGGIRGVNAVTNGVNGAKSTCHKKYPAKEFLE